MQIEQSRAEQGREQTWPGQGRAGKSWGELTDCGTQTQRYPEEREEAQFVRAHQRRNIRLGRLLTKHNSTRLDWTGCEWEYECWCESEYWSGAGDESVDGGDDSLSSFQSSLAPFLRLSASVSATRRFLIEMFCTIFLRITTCCLRHREAAISAFPFPPTPNALLALNECNVQRATTTTWLNSSLAARVNCTRGRKPQEQCAALTIIVIAINLQPANCKLLNRPTSTPQPSSSSLSTPSWAHDKNAWETKRDYFPFTFFSSATLAFFYSSIWKKYLFFCTPLFFVLHWNILGIVHSPSRFKDILEV